MSTIQTIHKAFKFRIYPNSEQQRVFARHFGHCRFVYNHFLRERIDFYESHKDQPKGVKKGLTYHDNAASLTQLKKQSETLWLKEVNSQSLQASLKHLDKAYQRFFKEKKGFPKFKSKHHKQSFNVPQRFVFFSGKKPSKTLLGQRELASTHSWLKIPNLPKSAPLLRVKEHRKISKGAKILSITISKPPTGKLLCLARLCT